MRCLWQAFNVHTQTATDVYHLLMVQLRGVEDELNEHGCPFLCTLLSFERRLTRLVLADLPMSGDEDPGLQVGFSFWSATGRSRTVTRNLKSEVWVVRNCLSSHSCVISNMQLSVEPLRP